MNVLKMYFSQWLRGFKQPTTAQHTSVGILGRTDLPPVLGEKTAEPPPQTTERLVEKGAHSLWGTPPED